jgi:hypothetical protein
MKAELAATSAAGFDAIALETNMPKDLADAVRLKQSARLDPGAEFTTTVAVTLGGSLP